MISDYEYRINFMKLKKWDGMEYGMQVKLLLGPGFLAYDPILFQLFNEIMKYIRKKYLVLKHFKGD